MTNHIRRKIFKINEQLQTDVPRHIASQAMIAERQNRLKNEILKRAPVKAGKNSSLLFS